MFDTEDRFAQGKKITGIAVSVNVLFAIIKISTGIFGNSFALIADGMESTLDVISSLIVYGGFRISTRPPDKDHPFGHGKAESLAGLLVALTLIASAFLIAINSLQGINEPHASPEPYTLVVLILVILVKEFLFRNMSNVGEEINSSSIKNDAWHYRSDAITSLAAFIGISISLIGGDEYAAADDWAALLSCGIIVFNGLRLVRPSLNEIMDSALPNEIVDRVIEIALLEKDVKAIEKCRVRKSGLYYLADIHVVVDGGISVREGHLIGHKVKERLQKADLGVQDVHLHIEPDTKL